MSTFQRHAKLAEPSGAEFSGRFVKPDFLTSQGLACWAEYVDPKHKDEVPWLAIHGGPGGATNPDLIYPLRQANRSWFAFDQRNSGISSDLPSGAISTHTFVDDAIALADTLGLTRYNILGGSWGATLAIALAARQPERVGHLVLRGPFIPLKSRVQGFFERASGLAPSVFDNHMGSSTDPHRLCNWFLSLDDIAASNAAQAWQALEMAMLLNKALPNDWAPQDLQAPELSRLLRKYRLQAHFLSQDCFVTNAVWQSWLSSLENILGGLFVVQGELDNICPMDGAISISQAVKQSVLRLEKNGGHLAGDKYIRRALCNIINNVK